MNSAGRRKRRYHAPARAAAAERTRLAVVAAAKGEFESRGWAGTTLRAVAAAAEVSLKTVEALYGTKGALLTAVVDFSIRGDLDPTPLPGRDAIARMEAAADARSLLELHAAHIRAVDERSARVAWAVEHAASSDASVAELWRGMNENRRHGVRWATRTLLGKPGHDETLTVEETEALFWVAFDWGTYRTLTMHAGLAPDEFQEWLGAYYRRVFLASAR